MTQITEAIIGIISEILLNGTATNPEIEIEGYYIISRDRDWYDGCVCTFIRNDSNISERSDWNNSKLEAVSFPKPIRLPKTYHNGGLLQATQAKWILAFLNVFVFLKIWL